MDATELQKALEILKKILTKVEEMSGTGFSDCMKVNV